MSSAATLFLIVQSEYWLLENKLYFCRSGLSCSAFEARRIFEFLVLAMECGLKNTYILHARSLSAPRPAFQFLVLTSNVELFNVIVQNADINKFLQVRHG